MAEKKRVTFTIEQKKQIFERREECPEESFTTKRKFSPKFSQKQQKKKAT